MEGVEHGWAMANLASSSSGGGKENARLALGIPDTVLFADGSAQAWLFTSRSGEVVRKRALQAGAVRDRFLRLALTNPNNPQQRVAILRFQDGSAQLLGEQGFKDAMTKFPLAPEKGVVALQCYIQSKGAAGTVFRNSFRVVDDKGRVVTSTATFTTLDAAAMASDPARAKELREAPMTPWAMREPAPARLVAGRVSTALDATTAQVVRFVEGAAARRSGQPLRILSMEADYAVDAAGQVWLMWTGPASLAVGAAALDLRLADVRQEAGAGRGGFLGMEAARALAKAQGPPDPKLGVTRTRAERRRRAAGGGGEGNGGGDGDGDKDIEEMILRAAGTVELPETKRSLAAGGGGITGKARGGERSPPAPRPLEGTGDLGDTSQLLGGMTMNASEMAARRHLGESHAVDDNKQQTSLLSTMAVGVRGAAGHGDSSGASPVRGGRRDKTKSFPTAFKCAGDYCSVRVQDRRRSA